MDERVLVTEIKKGNPRAVQYLFEQYQDYVYNICYRMSGNRQEAEDGTQDVFIQIYRAMGQFRGESKLSTWIYRITFNTCLKRTRRKKLYSWVSLDFVFQDKEKIQPVSPEVTPDRQMEIAETEHIVMQAIQQLPVRQKAALILYRFESLSYEEIAQVMEISLSAVESLLHRAKENLAVKLIPLKKYL